MLLNIAGVNKIIIVMPKSCNWNFYGWMDQQGQFLTNEAEYPRFLKEMMCRVTSLEKSNDCLIQELGASGLASVALALIASLWLVQ